MKKVKVRKYFKRHRREFPRACNRCRKIVHKGDYYCQNCGASIRDFGGYKKEQEKDYLRNTYAVR